MQPRAATASRHHPEEQPGPPEAATAAVPAPLTGARPSLSGSPFHGGLGRHHRLRGPVCTHAVRPVPPPSPERVGQGRRGRNPHFDISAQRFCAGLGQSGLQLANRLPDGPVAGHVSRRPVFFPKRIVPDVDISAACNNLARLDDDGKTLDIPVGHVRALLAERTWTAAGTCFPPGLEWPEHATAPLSTESEVPVSAPKCAGSRNRIARCSDATRMRA